MNVIHMIVLLRVKTPSLTMMESSTLTLISHNLILLDYGMGDSLRIIQIKKMLGVYHILSLKIPGQKPRAILILVLLKYLGRSHGKILNKVMTFVLKKDPILSIAV